MIDRAVSLYLTDCMDIPEPLAKFMPDDTEAFVRAVEERADPTTRKLTFDDFVKIFGGEIPIEAIDLVWNSPETMTIAEVRTKLNEMAIERFKKAVLHSLAFGASPPPDPRKAIEGAKR